MAFRIGVTGSRTIARLSKAEQDTIHEQIDDVLRAVGALAEDIARDPAAGSVYQHAPSGPLRPWLRVISPLAEGADRIVASLAMERGYELRVVLPFARAEYAKDFKKAASRAEFDELLSQGVSADRPALALDGERETYETRSYEAVGRLVVFNCDLLIAVWDGQPARGRGGTGDIVRFAARFGRPIWWIDATGAAPPRLLLSISDLRAVKHVPQGAEAEAQLAKIVRRMLMPPPKYTRHPLQRQSVIGRILYGLYEFGRRLPGSAGRSLRRRLKPYRDPLRTFLSEKPLPDSALWRLYDRAFRLVGGAPNKPAQESVSQPAPSPAGGPAAYWNARHRPADRAAASYGDRYRSSYAWIIFLANMAVVCAVTALVHEPLKPMATLVEAGLLLIILAFVAINELRNWHGRWIAYRLLAELCRMQGALALLGWSLPPPALRGGLHAEPAKGADPEPAETWVGWYFSATARASPLPTGGFDALHLSTARDYALTTLIDEQSHYHEDRRMRSQRVGNWLFQAGQNTFFATLLFVLAKLVALLLFGGHGSTGHADGTVDHLHAIIVALGAIAAILPAASAAFVGIRAYAELELVENQSAQMAASIDEAGIRINRLALDQPLASQDLAAEVFDVSLNMLQESGGWVELFKVKAVEAG